MSKRNIFFAIFLFFGIGILSVPVADLFAITTCPANFTPQFGVCFPDADKIGLGSLTVLDLLQRFMNWLLGIVGVLAVIAFIISGVQYLVSSGDEEVTETAKRNMKYAIIGLVIALSGLIVVNAVAGLTGATGATAY
ncbi:MAG: pilin [Candidatus Moranbacteria bacterium]|nr:pilin [Candidatus Moranbacteria bacterium]